MFNMSIFSLLTLTVVSTSLVNKLLTYLTLLKLGVRSESVAKYAQANEHFVCVMRGRERRREMEEEQEMNKHV